MTSVGFGSFPSRPRKRLLCLSLWLCLASFFLLSLLHHGLMTTLARLHMHQNGRRELGVMLNMLIGSCVFGSSFTHNFGKPVWEQQKLNFHVSLRSRFCDRHNKKLYSGANTWGRTIQSKQANSVNIMYLAVFYIPYDLQKEMQVCSSLQKVIGSVVSRIKRGMSLYLGTRSTAIDDTSAVCCWGMGGWAEERQAVKQGLGSSSFPSFLTAWRWKLDCLSQKRLFPPGGAVNADVVPEVQGFS